MKEFNKDYLEKFMQFYNLKDDIYDYINNIYKTHPVYSCELREYPSNAYNPHLEIQNTQFFEKSKLYRLNSMNNFRFKVYSILNLLSMEDIYFLNNLDEKITNFRNKLSEDLFQVMSHLYRIDYNFKINSKEDMEASIECFCKLCELLGFINTTKSKCEKILNHAHLMYSLIDDWLILAVRYITTTKMILNKNFLISLNKIYNIITKKCNEIIDEENNYILNKNMKLKKEWDNYLDKYNDFLDSLSSDINNI